jgi:uncharacterized integral membrane protein (TIGR00698 family)
MTYASLQRIWPGLIAAVIIAIAALFLAEHYHASAMLFALLLGMAVNFLGQEGRTVEGVKWTSSTLLRIGVALLGLRITFGEIASLGVGVTLLVVFAVIATIVFGVILSHFIYNTPHERQFGFLSGGSVAICGASAALAVAAILPKHAMSDRDTSFTIIGVTALSTIAMVIYPLISHSLGFTDRDAGIFLGATIHDVAQVIGAGYSVSQQSGDTATIVKLLRVAMLLPVILVLSILFRRHHVAGEGKKPPLLPWFAVAFGAFVALNSWVLLPKELLTFVNDASRFLLVTAIAAIGMKTQLKELIVLGWRPVLLIVAETLFLAALIIAAMKIIL